MSKRIYDDWISAYLEYVDNTEPPNMFKIWVGVSTICACLQRKCKLPWGDPDLYPNMYIVLVGPSGCRKGTAMYPSADFLTRLGIRRTAEAITREALIQALSEATTMDIHDENMMSHCSLTIFSEELTVFLGQNNWQLMSDLNNWYDCRPTWTYRTKNMGTDEIIGVWVNLLGATTPEFLQSALPQDAIGGGLASRIVFVYGDKRSKICPAPFKTDKDDLMKSKLCHDLEAINALKGDFKFTPDFFNLWLDWYNKDSTSPPFEDENFLGYNQRRSVHLRKLCMVMSASRGDDLILTVEDFNRSVQLLIETEKYMPFVFGGRGRAKNSVVMEKIIRMLAVNGTLTGTKIMQLFYRDITVDEMHQMLSSIEKAGIGIIRRAGGDIVVQFIRPEEKVE
jgi:hypothetical protein